jgi:renalase
MNMDKRVAIIGAGIAGLSCATLLQQAGFVVTLFEKSRGVSGRLSTRVTDAWQCDHGAQYFTARDPLFDMEVQSWVTQDVARIWQPRLMVFDGTGLIAKVDDGKNKRYVGYPRNHTPAKFIAKALNVVTESTVIGIHQQAGQWLVNVMEQGVYPESFDSVILAIPAPQAAQLLKNNSSALYHFCNAIEMRPCFALILQYQQRLPCQFDGIFVQTGPLSWVARDSSKPGRNSDGDTISEVWVLHSAAEWSAKHVDADRHWITKDMLSAFNHLLKMDASVQTNAYALQAPHHFSLHRWLYADTAASIIDIYHYDASERIGICGDWLNGGKVQGAWLSGLRLAQALISAKISDGVHS